MEMKFHNILWSCTSVSAETPTSEGPHKLSDSAVEALIINRLHFDVMTPWSGMCGAALSVWK